jgi:Uma2 family endonuclease
MKDAGVRQDFINFERWERIDGTIYDMSPPPSSTHQSIVTSMSSEIYNYLKLKGKSCQVFVAPFAVWLDNHEAGDYVEPDITVVCDKSKITAKGCVGVPDMIVEVLSPSTAVKDKGVKLRKYRMAGVKEYWIVDPLNGNVEVYRAVEDHVFGEREVVGSDGNIKVGIFEDLEIDLREIFM